MCKLQQLRLKWADSSRMRLPFRHGPGALTTPGKTESGGVRHTVWCLFGSKQKMAFLKLSIPPHPPCHSLLLFCLMFVCVCWFWWAGQDSVERCGTHLWRHSQNVPLWKENKSRNKHGIIIQIYWCCKSTCTSVHLVAITGLAPEERCLKLRM